MILCDTNIVSEFMNPSPNPNVVQWFNQQDATNLYISTVSIAEIYYGLNLLPLGKRRTNLTNAFERFSALAFATRLLDFTADDAKIYGEIRAQRLRNGKPMSTLDAQIAAIALVHHHTVATRNTTDFEGCGLQLMNPFGSP